MFQRSDFSFSHVKSAIALCKTKIEKACESDDVVDALLRDREKPSKLFSCCEDFDEKDAPLIRNNGWC